MALVVGIAAGMALEIILSHVFCGEEKPTVITPTPEERRKMYFMKEIKIRYHAPIPELHNVGGEKSDWIDMYAAEDVKMNAGESRLISLGVSMKLPEGYEAHLLPRSSTFKKWGIIQTNHMGVIDNSYSGDNDIWMMPVYAVRDTEIKFGDRICQFRLMKKMNAVSFEKVDHLDGADRGGFGSTGS